MKAHFKQKSLRKIIIVLFVVLIVILAFVYYFFNVFNNELFFKSGNSKRLVNPVSGLSLEEGVENFDENYIRYLLISVGGSRLHPSPFSSDTPKIELNVGNRIYYAEVVDGKVIVGEGRIENEDAVITTDVEEIVKMLMDRNYILESYRNGLTRAEARVSNLELISKGYLQLYGEFS